MAIFLGFLMQSMGVKTVRDGLALWLVLSLAVSTAATVVGVWAYVVACLWAPGVRDQLAWAMRQPLVQLGWMVCLALGLSAWHSPWSATVAWVLLPKYAKLLVFPIFCAAMRDWFAREPLALRTLGWVFALGVAVTAVAQGGKWLWHFWDPSINVDGMFHDHISTSVVYALGLGALVLCAVEAPLTPWVWLAMIGLLGLLLGVNHGRTGILCVLGFVPLAVVMRWRWGWLAVAALAVLAAGLASVVGWGEVIDRFHHLGGHTQVLSNGIRLQLWRDGWAYLGQHPWGGGLGAQRFYSVMPHAHSTVVNMAVQLGWLGVALSVAWFAWVWRICAQQAPSLCPWALGFAWVITVLSVTDSLWLGVTYGYLALLGMSVWLGLRQGNFDKRIFGAAVRASA